jgi:hypothetical protein
LQRRAGDCGGSGGGRAARVSDAGAEAGDLALTDEGGFLPDMVKAALERGLAAERTGHLEHEKGDPAGRVSANSRNGTTPKTLATTVAFDVVERVPASPRPCSPHRMAPPVCRKSPRRRSGRRWTAPVGGVNRMLCPG